MATEIPAESGKIENARIRLPYKVVIIIIVRNLLPRANITINRVQ